MARKKVLLTLGQIAERTGISYGTVVRYAKLHGAKIPSEGTGRKKRYPPAAVKVFEQLREETKRGRPVRNRNRYAQRWRRAEEQRLQLLSRDHR